VHIEYDFISHKERQTKKTKTNSLK